MTEQNKVTAFS